MEEQVRGKRWAMHRELERFLGQNIDVRLLNGIFFNGTLIKIAEETFILSAVTVVFGGAAGVFMLKNMILGIDSLVSIGKPL